MVQEVIYKMLYCTFTILVSSSRLLPAVQQIPLLRGHWSATGDSPVIGCNFLFHTTEFVKHPATSGRRSWCGVSFPLSCGVWPLLLVWCMDSSVFSLWLVPLSVNGSSCWGMAVFFIWPCWPLVCGKFLPRRMAVSFLWGMAVSSLFWYGRRSLGFLFSFLSFFFSSSLFCLSAR